MDCLKCGSITLYSRVPFTQVYQYQCPICASYYDPVIISNRVSPQGTSSSRVFLPGRHRVTRDAIERAMEYEAGDYGGAVRVASELGISVYNLRRIKKS